MQSISYRFPNVRLFFKFFRPLVQGYFAQYC